MVIRPYQTVGQPLNALLGEVVYVDVAGQDIVSINTYEAAINLLEKRSSLHSDRPHTPMIQL